MGGASEHLRASTPLQVLAGGEAQWKAVGATIDWSTVVAVTGSPVTLPDGTVVPVGRKYLRLGQVMCRITATGKFGPYDFAAADGRQVCARGDCFILNETILELGATPDLGTVRPTDHPGFLEGGLMWETRILATTGTHSLANGPTFAELYAAMPLVRAVRQ
jgi:hypothetical protein